MEGSLYVGEHKLSVGYNTNETITITLTDVMDGWCLHSDASQVNNNVIDTIATKSHPT